jgi:hypothetical protein
MKNRTENKMIKAYECMVKRMKNSGLGLKKASIRQQVPGKIQNVHQKCRDDP